MNRSSNLVVDAIGGEMVAHTGLQQYPGTGNQNQRWFLNELSEPYPGAFSIWADDQELVWDVPDSNSGTQIQLFPWHGGYNQRWRIITAVVLDVFSIKSAATDFFLEVRDYSQDDGAIVHQASGNPIFGNLRAFNQLWAIIELTGASVKIMSLCSGKILDYPLNQALQNRPAFVSQYEDNDGLNQRWFRDPASRGDIIVSASNGFALDVPAGLPIPLLPVQAYPRNDGLNQVWEVRQLL
jgi:hypothetical protein